MLERSRDWLRQAERDLENARWEAEGKLHVIPTDGKKGFPMSTSPKRMPTRPSVVQERSYGSVRVFWLNREEVLRRLREAVQKLLAEREDIKEIRLFGSLAEGRAVPGSDVDLLLVMEKNGKTFLGAGRRPLGLLRRNWASL